MTNKPYTFAIRTIQPHKAKIAKEYGFLTLNQTTEKRGYAYNSSLAKWRVQY